MSATLARTAPRRALLAGGVLAAGALALLYAPVVRDLLDAWSRISYHTYGFFIAPFSVWLAWESRDRAIGAPIVRWRPGLAVAAAGLGLLALGTDTESLALRALSLPVTLAGVGLFALGPDGFRPFAFPVGFLALMTPLPHPALMALSLPLQWIASAFTTVALNVIGIPAVRDGLFITLPDVVLHVSEDCNGLRFLLAMAVIGVAFGALTQRTLRARLLVVALALVTGLVANLLRVAGTGVVAHVWGREAASGLAHLVYGKTVYLVTMVPFVLAVIWLRRADAGPPRSAPD
jgi:exosortase